MSTTLTYKGLQHDEVISSRQQHGSNKLVLKDDRVFLHVLKEVVQEPMFILLVVSCSVYFILRQQQEGLIMLASIFIVSGISFYQEYRSRNAINALKKYSTSMATVIREGTPMQIEAEDIVVDDVLLLEEGEIVPADGVVLSSNDFSVNESILTGEAFSVSKSSSNGNEVFKGTLVVSGSATIKVVAVGIATKFGKIGLSLKNIKPVETPLQLQMRSFVRNMAWFGGIAFLLVFIYNYYQSNSFTYGLLQGLTLAMSLLPEEIPVAFSAFMALGAYRLMKQQVIVKQPQYVETLGSATVICVDKTGTITENRMVISGIYDAKTRAAYSPAEAKSLPPEVIEYAMWASEIDPFDPMEKAIHELYASHTDEDKRPRFSQIHEYPLGGALPIMTHVFSDGDGNMVIASKGAPEAIIRQSGNAADIEGALQQALQYAQQGYRVLGVGKASLGNTDFPKDQQDFVFEFLGLIAFYDPPKQTILNTLQTFYAAGIKVKMITGDHAETAKAISKQVHLNNYDECLTGEEVMQLPEAALRERVTSVNIFARMFPDAKLKVIEALKANGEIVAMTGDGVNDAPALKAAQIGIAMGHKGSEVAKGAASLIITDDDLFHMTQAIALGRKIYDNLQKAIQYIVSIHIPIILIVTLPLVLAWKFTNIFSPVHVIFLELIMGPTCSIIYENETMEAGTMQRSPRKLSSTFLSFKQLSISIVQGVMIAAGCLVLGGYYMRTSDEITVRTVIFIALLFSNIFLTLVNRSFYYSILTTITYRNWLMWLIVALSLVLLFSTLYVPAVRQLFYMTALRLNDVLLCMLVAFISTIWIELYKLYRRKNVQKPPLSAGSANL